MPWELQLLLTAHPGRPGPPCAVREQPAPGPRPQAHLIIHCLGKDLELALCGEEGAVIGASLKGWREQEGWSARGMAPPWAPLSLLMA